MKINLSPKTNGFRPLEKYLDWAMREKTVIKNNVAKPVTNYSRLQEFVPEAFMTYAQMTQCYFLCKSDDIPKERKVPLIWNSIYTCAIGLVVGFALKKPINNLREVMLKRANELYALDKNKEMMINGIKTAVPFLVSAILFRYLGHVVATPLSTQTTDYLVKKGLVDMSKKEDKK